MKLVIKPEVKRLILFWVGSLIVLPILVHNSDTRFNQNIDYAIDAVFILLAIHLAFVAGWVAFGMMTKERASTFMKMMKLDMDKMQRECDCPECNPPVEKEDDSFFNDEKFDYIEHIGIKPKKDD